MRTWSSGQEQLLSSVLVTDMLQIPGVHTELHRSEPEWLLETISSGLRTVKGINVDAICMKTGYSFQPRPSVERALRQGLMLLDAKGILTLKEEEWYRETGWALEASLSFS